MRVRTLVARLEAWLGLLWRLSPDAPPIPSQVLVDPKLVAGRNRLQEELRTMLSRVDANAAAKVAAARPASAPIRAAPRTPGPRAAHSTFGTAKSAAGGGGGAHALREIEKLRREQNAALLAAIDAEQKRELLRERELEVAGASVTATADRERLIKVRVAPPRNASNSHHLTSHHLASHRLTAHHTSHLTRLSNLPFGPDLLARAVKADADLMELTAKHELALASKMAKLGMTR